MNIQGMGAEGRANQRVRREASAGVERRDGAERRPQRSGRDGGADRVKEGVPSERRAQAATRGAEVRSEVDLAARSDDRGVERTLEQYREYLVRERASEGRREGSGQGEATREKQREGSTRPQR